MTPGSNLSQDLRLDLFSPPMSLHCSVHCLSKIDSYMQFLHETETLYRYHLWSNFSQLWFISVLNNQKALQNTFQTTTFNVEENSRTFQDCMKHWKQSSFSITITITPLWKNRSKVKPRWFKYRRSFYFKAQQRLKKYESLNKSHNNISTNRHVQIDRSIFASYRTHAFGDFYATGMQDAEVKKSLGCQNVSLSQAVLFGTILSKLDNHIPPT